MRSAWTFIRTLVVGAFAIATVLGVISGCVAAVSWGVSVVGTIPIIVAGAFVAGCIITVAVYAAAGHSLG